MGSSGTIIGTIALKDAILFAYDTKTHRGGEVVKILNVTTGEHVELKNQKVYLAQYCAFAASGQRQFSYQIHDLLLEEVTKSLVRMEGPKQLSASQLRDIVEISIGNQVEKAKYDYENDPSEFNRKQMEIVEEGWGSCGLALGTWEFDKDGKYTPKLKTFRGGEFVEKLTNYCALGTCWEYAEELIKNEYKEEMSVEDGVDLLVRALKKAASKDPYDILGGDIEVLILGPRDIQKLPLSRTKQALDRAITIYNLGEFTNEEEKDDEGQDQPAKKQRVPKQVSDSDMGVSCQP